MKKSILLLLSAVLLMSCGGKNQSKQANNTAQKQSVAIAEDSSVTVYYFHGKQRCKTCVAVGDLAKKTIENNYAGNDKIKFIEIDTSDKQFKNLVDKYEIAWNALIIAKGDDFVDITDQAFANAVNNPDVLSDLITEEVTQRIEL